MTKSRIIRITLCALPLVMAVGCSSGGSAHAFRMDPTPQLDARGETYNDIQNQIANSRDTNFRSLNNDIGRLWFTNRPSRLATGPKPY